MGGGGGVGGWGGAAWKSRHTTAAWEKWKKSCVDPEGGGDRGVLPPGKSQVICVDPEGGGGPDRGVRPPRKITSYMGFYREKASGPLPEKVGPPPLTWNKLNPLRNLEN